MSNHPYHHHDRGDQQQDYRGVGPKNYKRSDERIYEDVCERLTQNGQIDASHVQVDVKDGEVTLSGNVFDRRMKRLAEDVADSVTGVQDVHNQLKTVENQNPGQQYQGEQRGPSHFQGQRQQGQGQGRSRGNRDINQSGNPGGGQGRVDRVGRSGVYPASGPWPEGDAEVQGEMGWGQGERGEEGYYDSGSSSVEASFENQRNKNRNRNQNR